MRLFVDYTNWKGVRAWREIAQPGNGQPLAIQLGSYHEYAGEDVTTPKIKTLVMHVSMIDKGGERRTLRVDHIHGFRVED